MMQPAVINPRPNGSILNYGCKQTHTLAFAGSDLQAQNTTTEEVVKMEAKLYVKCRRMESNTILITRLLDSNDIEWKVEHDYLSKKKATLPKAVNANREISADALLYHGAEAQLVLRGDNVFAYCDAVKEKEAP